MLWNVSTGRVMRLFGKWVRSAAFSPDGRQLVASSKSGTTYFYLLTLDELSGYGFTAVLYPVTLMRLAMKAMEAGLAIIASEGTRSCNYATSD